MTVQEINLYNFRNFQAEHIELSPSVNIFCGENAQGKTNLIESLFFLSCLRPLKNGSERDLIRFGESEARVSARVQGLKEDELTVCLFAASRRQTYKNKVKIAKVSDFAGILKTVTFSPDDLMIIKEGAAGRRRLIDIPLCQLFPRYYAALVSFNRCLEQKNRILKGYEENPALLQILPEYNKKLIEHGAEIIFFRTLYVKKLADHARLISDSLSSSRDRLEVRYRSLSNIEDTCVPLAKLKALYSEHLESHGAAEIASRSCLSGPHKDDLDVIINGQSAKSFASQGQTRTAILSLKLAERDIFYQECGQYPVLLLDDVLSELDGERQKFVLNRILQGQVVVSSCCIPSDLAVKGGRVFRIESGRISDKCDL